VKVVAADASLGTKENEAVLCFAAKLASWSHVTLIESSAEKCSCQTTRSRLVSCGAMRNTPRRRGRTAGTTAGRDNWVGVTEHSDFSIRFSLLVAGLYACSRRLSDQSGQQRNAAREKWPRAALIVHQERSGGGCKRAASIAAPPANGKLPSNLSLRTSQCIIALFSHFPPILRPHARFLSLFY
jgi:hypothetical protein